MSTVFLDGEYLDSDKVRFGPTLFSLNYAVCAFEGIRCYNTVSGLAVFRLKEHLARFRQTCDFLGFDNRHLDEDTQYRATINLVRTFDRTDLYIRPIAFVDEGIMRLDKHPAVRSCIFAIPLPPPGSVPIIGLGVASRPRSKETISQKISRNYFDPYLGLKSRKEGDDDLLFLDQGGFVTETSAHNIFFISSTGKVSTPATTHCLPGITRDAVINLLGLRGHRVDERDIHVSEVSSFVAAFTTSTASEIRAISRIDEASFDPQNDILRELACDFRECVNGQFDKRKKWNCYV